MSGIHEGQCAIITGSSGIGLGAAIKLAREGARVHLCGIDNDHNEAAKKACEGLDVTVSQVDISVKEELHTFVNSAASSMGGIDIIVNAAGIQTYGTLESTDSEHWDKVMAVNLRACFLTSRYAYPYLKASSGGSIIHISSVQGHSNQYGVLAYATSKGAIHALTRAMAADCAKDNIRVNSISPGSIRTPLLEFAASECAGEDNSVEDMIKEFGSAHPIGRVGTVDEVAELISYLAGPNSGFCTGGDYLIDGGLTSVLGV